MSKSVDRNIVNLVASMLTDDPDILIENTTVNEMSRYSRFSRSRRSHNGGGISQYEDDQVPLDDETIGNVIYDYEVQIHGHWHDQTYDSPAEAPELTIGKITNMNIVGYRDGEEVQPTPQEVEIWKKSAIDYFHGTLEDKVIRREYEKLSNGNYDYEPDEDQLRRADTGEDY